MNTDRPGFGPGNYDDTGYDDTHEVYNQMADWLRDQTLKLTSDLGNGQKVIDAFLEVIEVLRAAANPDREHLASMSLARFTLRRFVMAHEDEDGFPETFRRVHTD